MPISFSLMLWLAGALVFLYALIFVARLYRRCPSNRIMVVYGRVGKNQAARCIHGGGSFVIPLIQDYAYLSLAPISIDIDLRGALSKKNIRVNVPSTFTIGISTRPDIMQNAAERLLDLSVGQISAQAQDIILGQMRLVLATLSIEEINQDREKFLDLVNNNVNVELNKIGLEVINVNIRDITDESGYIEAIGKKAAAEAINTAKVEVAQQERQGAIGQATAQREREVQVAREFASSEIGQKEAERDQRITVSKYEAEGVAGEARAEREKQVAVAEQRAQTVQGEKSAERDQRLAVADLEADSVRGENVAAGQVAHYHAKLKQEQAEAKRTGEVALANASRDVLLAEKQEELARLEKMELARQEIEKKKVEVDAEAEAERIRRIAKGDADAILFKYTAEAEGIRKVLEAKAHGYRSMIAAVGEDSQLVPTLLVVEKLPELVAQQVKAVQALKIDKVTVWDGGGAQGNGSTAGFYRNLIGSLPPIHDLAKQVGLDLPDFLGKMEDKVAPEQQSAQPSGLSGPTSR